MPKINALLKELSIHRLHGDLLECAVGPRLTLVSFFHLFQGRLAKRLVLIGAAAEKSAIEAFLREPGITQRLFG